MTAGDIIVISEEAGGRKGNYFDGTDDYVLHDAHAVARVAANDTVGTYTAWIYWDDATGDNTILSAGDNNSATESMFFFINSSGELTIKISHGGATKLQISETVASLELRKWTHVAIVQDGVQPILYVNGLAVAATNDNATDLSFWYAGLTACDKFAIGTKESNATHTVNYKGAIGRTKYFALAMTPQEILEDKKETTHVTRPTAVEAARVFDISMADNGTSDSGSGADNGTLTGDAHYGGYISAHSQALEDHSTGHAAEFINTFIDGSKYVSILKKGD